MDGNNESLHSKYAVIDTGYKEALVITGSHNWTNDANEKNDENTVIIETTTVAALYFADHSKIFNYARRGINDSLKVSLSDILIYPHPAKTNTKVRFEVGSSVTSVKLSIYSLTGNVIRTENLTGFQKGFYNEYNWNLKNDTEENVANGIYLVSVIADTPDGKIVKNTKLAVER